MNFVLPAQFPQMPLSVPGLQVVFSHRVSIISAGLTVP